ncbi:MAG TPA: hypothetical protein VGZ22_27495 [Isosphaeraceae bacterium]|nr:hypothetical protein [Isosphaeraceae bacterium]
MTTGDARIGLEPLQGQEVFVPTAEAWRDVLRAGTLDGQPAPLPEWVAGWLDCYAKFDVAALGVVRVGARGWMLVQLFRLGGRTFRVHFEDVICEHCGRRCGLSATPDTTAYAGTGHTVAEVWAEFDGLPVEPCPHCGGMLRRRHTIWLAPRPAKPL